MFPGRPVRNVDEMAFDFDGDDYLDPAEEAEMARYLDDEEEDEDDDFEEEFEDEDEDDLDLDDEDDFDGDDW